MAERLVTTYHPAVKKLKHVVMENWSLKENQPLAENNFLKSFRSYLTKEVNL